MKQKLLSIIIAAFNAERYIGECIDSILNQSMCDWELIVVNDGSSDATECICSAYSLRDPRISVVSVPNGGVSSARNVGIEHATGFYIMFIDADDRLSPDSLEFYAQGAESLGFPDILRAEYQAVNEKGLVLFPSRAAFKKDNKFIPLQCRDFFTKCVRTEFFLWLLWIKRSCIKNKRFCPGRIYMEDAEFLFSLIPNIDSAAYTSKALYFYRKYDLAASSKINDRKLHDICAVAAGINKIGESESISWIKYKTNVFSTCVNIMFDYLCGIRLNDRIKFIESADIPELIKNADILPEEKNKFRLLYAGSYETFFRIYRVRRRVQLVKNKIKSLIYKFIC